MFCTLSVFAGEGTLFITNRLNTPVVVCCCIVSITGKELSPKVQVPKRTSHYSGGPVYWPSIQDLFPRETLRGLVFHIKTEVYDSHGHLLNRGQTTHIFHRNPNSYDVQEIYADLNIEITEGHSIYTHVGKSS